MLFENYNVIKEQGVIATKTNKFESETTMYSFHCCKNGDFDLADLKPDILPPVDVLYRSKQAGEQLLLVVSGEYIYSAGTVTINLNGNTNIVLTKDSSIDDIEEELFAAFSFKKYNDYELAKDLLNELCSNGNIFHHNFFSISKEDFLKCCQASTIAIQVKRNEHEVMQVWEDTDKWSLSNILLPIFRSLYNKAIDSSMFVDAEKEAIALFEELEVVAPKKKKGFFGLFK